jgi:hypothetical protein
MFKSLKAKTIGLGICCLAFAFSGSARASVIDVDYGKYGKHFDKSCKDLDICKFGDFKFDLKDLLKDLKCLKDDKGKGDDKDGKDKDQKTCKIDWGKDKDHKDVCYGDDKKHDKCDDVVDCDHHPVCDPHPCDPHAVPAPAASLMSGFGVICVGLMGWLKNRRSVKA